VQVGDTLSMVVAGELVRGDVSAKFVGIARGIFNPYTKVGQ